MYSTDKNKTLARRSGSSTLCARVRTPEHVCPSVSSGLWIPPNVAEMLPCQSPSQTCTLLPQPPPAGRPPSSSLDTHTHLHTHRCTHIHACSHCSHIHRCTHIHACLHCSHAHTHTGAHTCMLALLTQARAAHTGDMYMLTQVHTHAHTAHTCSHTHRCTHIQACLHCSDTGSHCTHTGAHTHTQVRAHTHRCTHARLQCLDTHARTHTGAHICKLALLTQARTALTHTDAHTYTHAHLLRSSLAPPALLSSAAAPTYSSEAHLLPGVFSNPALLHGP